ncbi:MAG: hypothetical protein NVSMB27_10790 [Ktedonobacteraceae bacterium]
MAEHTFSFEQIRHQAQENALAFLLASVVYFKEQDLSQFIAGLGNTLAPGWKDLKGHGARVVMNTLALHIVSLGGTIVGIAGDDDLAYATFAHVPSSDVLKFFGLTRDEADAIWDIYKPMASSIKLWYTWSRQQNEVTFKLSRVRLPDA